MTEVDVLALWYASGLALHIAMLNTDEAWVYATKETAKDLGYGAIVGHLVLLLGIATFWPVLLWTMVKIWTEE